jgi:hypothetical protein
MSQRLFKAQVPKGFKVGVLLENLHVLSQRNKQFRLSLNHDRVLRRDLIKVHKLLKN